MRLSREEDDRIRREDREFQFEMFRIRLLHNFLISFSTVMMAVSVSWIAAMYSLSFRAEIPAEEKLSILSNALNMLIVFLSVSILFIIGSYVIQRKLVGKLRKRYLPWKEEKHS